MLAVTYSIQILLMTFSGLVSRHQADTCSRYADEEDSYLQEPPRAPRNRVVCGPQERQNGQLTLEWDAEHAGTEATRDLTFGKE